MSCHVDCTYSISSADAAACGAVGCSVATGAVVVVVVSFAGASSDAPFLVNLEKSPMSRASVLYRASFQETFRASFVHLYRKKGAQKVPKKEKGGRRRNILNTKVFQHLGVERDVLDFFFDRDFFDLETSRPYGMFFIRRMDG